MSGQYKHPGYEYKEVAVQDTIAAEAQTCSDQGWETVAVIAPVGLALGWVLLVKREKQNPYSSIDDWVKWEAWNKAHPQS